MTADERSPERRAIDGLIARIAVLEGMCGATLALYIANARNDPTGELAAALIAAIRKDVIAGIAHLPPHMKAQAEAYLDNFVSQVTARLPSLHAPGTPRNQ